MQRRHIALPCRMRPLAAFMVAAFAFSASAHATSLRVTNCRDDGSAGSLRSVTNRARNYDNVDLTALTCSTITLHSGPIIVSADYLLFQGSPQHPVTIDGNNTSSLIVHTGQGMLSIGYVNFRRGFKYENGDDDALGGCIFSISSVELTHAQLSECVAQFSNAKTHHDAKGGAIFAEGFVVLTESTITTSLAEVGSFNHPATGHAAGGAIYTVGGLDMGHSVISHNYAIAHGPHGYAEFGAIGATGYCEFKYSTIANNGAYADSDLLALGGAIGASGQTQITMSTISNNRAGEAGGLYLFGGTPAEIIDSTISGNYAHRAFGGILAKTPLVISSSTIAFNEANGAGLEGGGGIVLASGASLELESTIVADNTSQGRYDSNIDGFRGTAVTVTGANNLVRTSGASVRLPADTIISDPLLAALANNGGETQTHALLPRSPAIDSGNVVSGFMVDQRGSGFNRVVGPAADIGAFETGAGP